MAFFRCQVVPIKKVIPLLMVGFLATAHFKVVVNEQVIDLTAVMELESAEKRFLPLLTTVSVLHF